MILKALVQSLDKSILQRLPTIAIIPGFNTISISAKLSVKSRPVRRKTSFLYDEWRENSTFQKVPETTQTSSFTMTFMSLYILQVWILYDQCCPLWVTRESTFEEVPEPFRTSFLRWLLCLLYILKVWVLHDAQPAFFVMSDVRTHLLSKCRKQLLPHVLRIFWWLLYILHV